MEKYQKSGMEVVNIDENDVILTSGCSPVNTFAGGVFSYGGCADNPCSSDGGR